MLDQVHFLKSLGTSAQIIGENCEQAAEGVERRSRQIVHSSPKAFLWTKRWHSGFGLGKISPYDKLFAATLGEIAESEGTPRFNLLFLTKFSFNMRWRVFASSQSFSKHFKERKHLLRAKTAITANVLRFHFWWHLRAQKLKFLNNVTDMACCSHVQPFLPGKDADQKWESGRNRAYNGCGQTKKIHWEYLYFG